MSSACNLPHRLKGSLLAAAIIASLIVALGGAPAGAQPAPRIAVHTDAASFGAVAGPMSTIDFEALPGNASSCPNGPAGERVANPLTLSGVTFTDPACLTIGTLGQTNDRLLCLNPGGTIALPTGALGTLLNVTGIGDATASFRVTDGRGGTTTGSVQGIPFQITPVSFSSPDGIVRVEVLPGGIACFSSVVVSGAGPSAPATCAGLTPTKTAVAGVPTQGTAGRDVILGTPGNDIIRGGTGDDIICGVGGDDEIYGEGGNDTLHGDAGMDTLDGGFGDDALHGGDDADTLRGGGGNDTLRGGAGADTLEGDAGNDQLFGEADADILRGGTGNDRLEDSQGVGQTFDGGPGTNTCVGVGTATPPVLGCQAQS